MSKVRLSIQLDTSTGQVSLKGPLENRLLCFGLLGMAHSSLTRATIQDQQEAQPPSEIIRPELLVGMGRNGMG